jgi:hypothetical protein
LTKVFVAKMRLVGVKVELLMYVHIHIRRVQPIVASFFNTKLVECKKQGVTKPDSYPATIAKGFFSGEI